MKTFAFVFPGQGSQSVGMLDAWGDHPIVVAKPLQEASDALGEDVAKLIHEGPKEALALTTNTQPVMLVAACGGLPRLDGRRPAWRPQAVAGHSLGEYSALVAAGALTLGAGGAAGAPACAGHAGGRARRRRRHGGHSGHGCRPK